MVCKKCKTAYNQRTDICPYCGNRYMRSVKLKIITGSFTLVSVLSFCILYLIMKPEFFAKSPIIPSADPGNQSQETDYKYEPSADDPSLVYSGRDSDKTFLFLSEYRDALYKYVDKFSLYSVFLTKEGFLYNLSSKDYVKPGLLADIGLLSEESASGGVFFMYLRPSDFKSFGEVGFSGSTELEYFAVYEYNDGVAFLSDRNAGTLYRENFPKLLEKYNCSHGEITRPGKGSFDYFDAKRIIEDAGFNGEEVVIRYLAADEKYAAAMVSLSSDNLMVYQLLLQREETEGFEILLAGYEEGIQGVSAANRIAPDLNTDLLPVMNFVRYAQYQITDFTSFEEQLINEGYKIDGDTLIYGSGTNRYVYVIYASGLKFFGSYRGDDIGWEIIPCETYITAESILKVAEKDPPMFIIMQD